MTPVIIEVAVNGPSRISGNPHFPRTAKEISDNATTCLEAGASIVHNHIDQRLSGEACAERYAEVYRPILAAVPGAILCSGLGGAVEEPNIAECYAHVEPLARMGMRLAIADPGSMNFNVSDAEDGAPKGPVIYRNSYDDTRYFMDLLDRCKLGPSLSIFEPSFLRATIGYHRAGKLPKGALVKLYFGGDYSPFTREPSSTTFGLPPTRKALDAYLEMLEGVDLPWGVAVIGGDVLETGIAQMGIERGGHVRVGLEDYAGPKTPSNVEMVCAVADLARASGRGVATPAQARQILAIPET